MDEARATRFVGVSLDQVRAAGTGLYEVTTTSGIPVRLHDMTVERLVHDPEARTLIISFRYDEEQWTPPEAAATPVAVFSFDSVEVVEQQDEPAPYDTPPDVLGQVLGFDYDEPSGVFALSTFTTYWAFTADTASVTLRSADHQ